MSLLKKSDVNAIAQAHLRDRVNTHINPYHSGWYVSGRMNTAYLDWFTTNPAEASPSNQLNEIPRGEETRNAAISLANFYSRVVRGRWGLIMSGYGNNAAQTYYGYFAINNNAPGMANHASVTRQQAAGITGLSGTIKYADVQNRYDQLWNIINARRDQIEVNLMLCHGSYVPPPHSSRGRR